MRPRTTRSTGIKPKAACAAGLFCAATVFCLACGPSQPAEATDSLAKPAGAEPAATAIANTVAKGSSPEADGFHDTRTEAVVRAGPVEDVFLLTGEMKAVHSLELVTPRTEMWRVQIKWLADDGTVVKEGDRVVEFDNTAVAQTIEEKRLSSIQTEIDLEARKAALAADLEEKRFALERAKTEEEKAKTQASIPKELMALRDWQEKQEALKLAQAGTEKAKMDLSSFEVSSRSEIENLEIARDKARREIEAAQRSLDALSLKAPKNGIFVISENWNEDRKFQIGDTCWPGQTIGSIPDLTLMEAIPYLSEVDDGQIAAGMSARCVLDTYPDRVFIGRVEEVSPIADKKGFRVRVSLEHSDPALMRPGMSVRVEVVRKAWARALTVPKNAVRREKDQAFIERTSGGAPVPVRIAGCTPTSCVIDSGVNEGEHVILSAGTPR